MESQLGNKFVEKLRMDVSRRMLEDGEAREWFIRQLDERLWTMGWKRNGSSLTECIPWSTKAESKADVDLLMVAARRVLGPDPLEELQDAANGKSH